MAQVLKEKIEEVRKDTELLVSFLQEAFQIIEYSLRNLILTINLLGGDTVLLLFKARDYLYFGKLRFFHSSSALMKII